MIFWPLTRPSPSLYTQSTQPESMSSSSSSHSTQKVGVVGATGAVGAEMIKVCIYVLLASPPCYCCYCLPLSPYMHVTSARMPPHLSPGFASSFLPLPLSAWPATRSSLISAPRLPPSPPTALPLSPVGSERPPLPRHARHAPSLRLGTQRGQDDQNPLRRQKNRVVLRGVCPGV